jgi:hypothetical protein
MSAYKSLKINLLYLFIYKNNKKYKIHNTTNAINGEVFFFYKKTLKNTMDLVKV